MYGVLLNALFFVHHWH